MTTRLAAADLAERREVLPGRWLLAFHAPDVANGARAGQFVHVRTEDDARLSRRRPYPLHSTDAATGVASILVRDSGGATRPLLAARPGDPLDVLGPLGRPFEVDPRTQHLLLVSSGDGIAAIRLLADEAIRDGRQVTLLCGSSGSSEVYPSSLLPDEVEYLVATDDGSLGHHGAVTDLVGDYEAWADQAFASGPPALLAALA
ncbi:MAG TPA: hypothetical protein VD763_11390, partial [Candidatus Saccharimonadales bacterium]|nr:hypothetical protein [Candidatus Saccharimonadales bacterium]